MAMVELASRAGARDKRGGTGRPVSLAEIAEAQLLSLDYLEQLFARLRRCGLVASVRGPGGGYRLGRPAGQSALAEITDAGEEPSRPPRCNESGAGCMARSRRRTPAAWAALRAPRRLFLADVVEGRVLGRAAAPGLGFSLDLAGTEHPGEISGGSL